MYPAVKRQKIAETITKCVTTSESDHKFPSKNRMEIALYHDSVCGSILLPLPIRTPNEVFAFLRHANFDRFRRCLDVYHQDIIPMTNDHGQTILHILTIHDYPYQWIRLLMMRQADLGFQDHDGYTAAHYAVERDNVEMLKALTMKIYSDVKFLSEEQIDTIHQRSLKALTLRQNQGLTVFMLACFQQSIKCLDYLLQLDINDVNLQDQFGDTCLHYAAARGNEILIEKLLTQCQANVNGGNENRPSVLDVYQFHCEQKKISNQTIEQLLLSNQAINRARIRQIVNQSNDSEQTMIDNLTCSKSSEQLTVMKNV